MHNNSNNVYDDTPSDEISSKKQDIVQSLCNRSFVGVFCVVMLLFGFFCGCKGFYPSTESDLFLFLPLCSILTPGYHRL